MELAAEFVKSWMKLTKEWNAQLEEGLAPRLTGSQLHVLEILREHAPMKPSDLLPHLETTPAAVTALLDRMEKGGLVERRRDEQDRRIVWVNMTDLGRAEAERGVRLRNEIVSRYLERLSAHNRQLLVYLLGKVSGVAGGAPDDKAGDKADDKAGEMADGKAYGTDGEAGAAQAARQIGRKPDRTVSAAEESRTPKPENREDGRPADPADRGEGPTAARTEASA